MMYGSTDSLRGLEFTGRLDSITEHGCCLLDFVFFLNMLYISFLRFVLNVVLGIGLPLLTWNVPMSLVVICFDRLALGIPFFKVLMKIRVM